MVSCTQIGDRNVIEYPRRRLEARFVIWSQPGVEAIPTQRDHILKKNTMTPGLLTSPPKLSQCVQTGENTY